MTIKHFLWPLLGDSSVAMNLEFSLCEIKLKINMKVESLFSFRCLVESRKVIGFNAPDVHSGITANVYQ